MSQLTTNHLSTARLGAGSDLPKEKSSVNKVIWIVISAIIFVVIVAIYEVLKIAVTNYFHMKAVKNSLCRYQRKEIDRHLLSDHHNLISACVFGLIVILTAAIALPILFQWVKSY